MMSRAARAWGLGSESYAPGEWRRERVGLARSPGARGGGGARQKMERKFLVLLRHGRFGTMICMEILSLIKFVLIQVFGLVISLVAAGLFIFWIIRKFHSWKIAAAFSVILVGISFFLFMPYAFP